MVTRVTQGQTIIEFYTGSEIGIYEPYCIEGRDEGFNDPNIRLENFYAKILACRPLNDYCAGALEGVRRDGYFGPYATLLEAIDDMSDPFMGFNFGEAVLGEKPKMPKLRVVK